MTLPKLKDSSPTGTTWNLTTLTQANVQAKPTNCIGYFQGNCMAGAELYCSLPLTYTSPGFLAAIDGAGMLSMRGTGACFTCWQGRALHR